MDFPLKHAFSELSVSESAALVHVALRMIKKDNNHIDWKAQCWSPHFTKVPVVRPSRPDTMSIWVLH